MEDRKMSKKKITSCALAILTGGTLCLTAVPLSACGGGNSDSIVVMAEQFSGLFNPFYATSGPDMEVVSLTQLSMLTSDSNGDIVAGENEATAVLDYEIDSSGADTVYRFVLKNGLRFSDGKPLTMNDVMFNIYEYLDPVYTGSSTLYSVKIKGLTSYRTQTQVSGDGEEIESQNSKTAYEYAIRRRTELWDVFKRASDDNGNTSGSSGSESYFATPEEVRETIENHSVSPDYQEIIDGSQNTVDYNKKLREDYDLLLTNFEKELNDDYGAAKDAYDLDKAPYKGHDEFKSDVFKFLFYEGIITPNYGRNPVTNKEDTSIIESFNSPDISKLTDQETAVNYVFNRMASDDFETVLTATVAAANIITSFSAEAMQLILGVSDGNLTYPRVEGIVSLGHRIKNSGGNYEYALGSTDSVKVNGTDYKIAKQHNEDGTPKSADTYDILQVTLNGKDPKAIYNFSFAVAPVHYYSGLPVNIEENQFGVEYANASFQSRTIQSPLHNSVPVGAGPYKASDRNNSDTSSGSAFYNNNFVYYKRNDHFLFPVKTEKFRYQYVSSANAIDKLKAKEIDFVTPTFTKVNSDTLNKMEKNGFKKLFAWQLGYGYIGINAGKVANIDVRKAIMSAMQSELATVFYEAGASKVIDWPMSNQSWAYPKNPDGTTPANGHDYTQWTNKEAALEKINKYTTAALNSGVQSLKFKFTIAGASIMEHPTYQVFKQAVDLLNEANEKYNFRVKWDVEVVADSQALTKLATGSLAVWAAAWGSTIDPDMYQVYHKNSKATSVYSWGYREILGAQDQYSTEYNIVVNQLSPIIDEARSTDDREIRKGLYKTAMGYVLDLAVEMPVYQRQNLYAYNAKKLKGINDTPNPFTSPLEKIWEVEIIK